MPLDPYSLCPGGRNKKIRFCCPDMVKEIDQIDRLLESKQVGACLSLLESLEKDHPDCACLIAAKLSAYRTQERWDEALALAKTFHEKEPLNPLASSEYAISLAITGQVKAAVNQIIDAFENGEEGTVHSSLLDATIQVANCLLIQGLIMPAVGIANCLKSFPMVQEPATILLRQAFSIVELPLLLRDMIFEQYCPDDFPAKAEFEEALELISLMKWKQALAKLESLIEYAPHWPNLWRNIAGMRFWLLENKAGCDALHEFANLTEKIEDAADAEAARIFLSTTGLGDAASMYFIEKEITDTDKTLERMLSTPIFQQLAVDPRTFNSNNLVPPKAVFMMLDRPMAAPGQKMTLDTAASQVGTCLLFGKETDRPARIQVLEVFEDDQESVLNQLEQVLGEWMLTESGENRPTRQVSRSRMMIQYRFRYTPENIPSPEDRLQLEKDYYRQIFIERWINAPMGVFDGKSALEAAAIPSFTNRVLGAIEVLEFWMNEELGIEIANDIRTRLNLPTQDRIEVTGATDEERISLLESLPIWRWYRLDFEQIPAPALIEGLQIVTVMQEPRAATRIAEELLRRPMDSIPVDARFFAFDSLISVAQNMGRFDESLDWIAKAKNESQEKNVPDAPWCLYEITSLISMQQLERANAAINDIVVRYGQDENVLRALQQIFVRFGMLNPDGTPVNQPAARHAAPSEAPAQGLWTPDAPGEQQSGQKKSELWTPD